MKWLKKLFGKKEQNADLPVKEELEPVEAQEVQPERPAELVRKKEFVVNCPRCGAAVKVSGTASAYICGACSQVFRVRVEARMVKELTADELEYVGTEQPVAAEEQEPTDEEYEEEYVEEYEEEEYDEDEEEV